MADGSTSTGGFLLGTNEDTYRQYIDTCYCAVAEHNDNVAGFAIIFPDDVVRRSDVWTRRHSATWHIPLHEYEDHSLCYFEQFAFLPGHRRTAVALAYNITRHAFAMGHHTMFATTVNKPVRNLAAVPFIKAVNGIHAGNIDETYPVIGHINSDIYMLQAQTFSHGVQAHPLRSFLTHHITDLS